MTKDEILSMAREAAAMHGHTFKDVPEQATIEFIEAFAALVAEKEREECAKVVWDMKGKCWAYDHDTIAAAIRARGEGK
jgi:hypothetical protein